LHGTKSLEGRNSEQRKNIIKKNKENKMKMGTIKNSNSSSYNIIITAQ